ncbi:MAG: 50S ribosomal protein L25 [Ignavibacteria bacterium]|nr:50S ribosomal protein L25 [Ignavibacteria bacterium]
MSEITLKVEKRTDFKRSISRTLRKSGFVPGIYYISGGENIAIKAPELSLRPVISTAESRVINLDIDGDIRQCVLKDVQFDPITSKLIHFDLIGLKEGEKIRVEVPVKLAGNPIGVKEGGLLQFIMHKLEVQCLPAHLPSHIDLEITPLGIGDSIKVSDIKLENIEFMDDEHTVVVSVVPPTVVVEETPAAATETPAEPEVITKGKKEEESE